MFATVINGYFMNKVLEILYLLHSEAHRNEQVGVVRQGHRKVTRITERHFPEKIPDGKRKKCVVCSSSHERFRKTWIHWWCPNCKVGPCVEWCFSRYICTGPHFKVGPCVEWCFSRYICTGPHCKVGPCVEWCFSRYICTVYCIIYDNLWKTFLSTKPWRTNVPIILIFL